MHQRALLRKAICLIVPFGGDVRRHFYPVYDTGLSVDFFKKLLPEMHIGDRP